MKIIIGNETYEVVPKSTPISGDIVISKGKRWYIGTVTDLNSDGFFMVDSLGDEYYIKDTDNFFMLRCRTEGIEQLPTD